MAGKMDRLGHDIRLVLSSLVSRGMAVKKVIDKVDSAVTSCQGHVHPRVLGGSMVKQGFKPYHNSRWLFILPTNTPMDLELFDQCL